MTNHNQSNGPRLKTYQASLHGFDYFSWREARRQRRRAIKRAQACEGYLPVAGRQGAHCERCTEALVYHLPWWGRLLDRLGVSVYLRRGQ